MFGAENFRSEIVWRRTSAHANSKRNFAGVHDIILVYSKSPKYIHNEAFTPYSKAYIDEHFVHADPDGRKFRRSDLRNPGIRPNLRYDFTASNGITYKPHPNGWAVSHDVMKKLDQEGRLFFPKKADARLRKKIFLDESPGVPATDMWEDLPPIHASAAERLGYPTQKPRALLERIIAASSNPGDVVLDPFCGCGTAVDAAQKLGRAWIGIDVTHLAIGMIEDRMREGYPGIAFETIGVPRDLASAERLARDDPHQFQQWVCWQVGGFPRDRKGGDKGVDGWFNYYGAGGKIETGVISVKAGDIVNPTMVRDLGRVMERDKHRFGLFIMKASPTKGMRDEASSHPMIDTDLGRFPALQIVTLADLMHGRRPKLPHLFGPVKKAARVEMRVSHQKGSQGSLL